MRKIVLLAFVFALSVMPAAAKGKAKEFKIDFLCCGEMINIWDPAYSNAVLRAVFPYFKDFAKELNLPMPKLEQVQNFVPDNRKGEIGGGAELTNGFSFWFYRGVVGFYGPHSYPTKIKNYWSFPKFYGTPRMTEQEAIALARKMIKKLGYSLEDVFANFEPTVPPFVSIGTNTIPRYRIQWRDPRGESIATEIEVDAERKTIESLRFNNSLVVIQRPPPKVKIQPSELPDTPLNPVARSWRRMNQWTNDINHEYAYRLVPVVLRAAEDMVRRLGLDLPLPITPNQIRRFYCSNNGGSPYVDLFLKNNWKFVYRVNGITQFSTSRRFFDSEDIPFRLKDYVREWKLTEDQAVDLARLAVKKVGRPGLHLDGKPNVFRPAEIKGVPPIPRLTIQWVYPGGDKPRSEWIEVEVDCNRGTVEALRLDDVSSWGAPPDLGVPIEPDRVELK